MVQSFLYLKQKKPKKDDLIIRVVTVEVKSKASVPNPNPGKHWQNYHRLSFIKMIAHLW